MAYNKNEVKPVTVYVPKRVMEEIKRFHTSEGRPKMKQSAMIVNLLQSWYDSRSMAKKGVGSAVRQALS